MTMVRSLLKWKLYQFSKITRDLGQGKLLAISMKAFSFGGYLSLFIDSKNIFISPAWLTDKRAIKNFEIEATKGIKARKIF